MKVLVCGDRNWENDRLIFQYLDKLHANTEGGIEIIDGHARGADQFAHDWANKNGAGPHCFPAKWQIYGSAAGPIRNSQMLKDGKPDLVLAFHNNLEKSKGTKDMVTKALEAKLPVRIIKERGHAVDAEYQKTQIKLERFSR